MPRRILGIWGSTGGYGVVGWVTLLAVFTPYYEYVCIPFDWRAKPVDHPDSWDKAVPVTCIIHGVLFVFSELNAAWLPRSLRRCLGIYG